MHFALITVGLIAIAMVPRLASAQEASAGWSLEADTAQCILSSPRQAGAPVVQILRTTYGLDDFAVELYASLDRALPQGSVVVRVGDFTQPMELTGAGRRLITTGYDFQSFLRAFGQSDVFEIRVGGEVHAVVPLVDSEAALQQLDACIADAYDGAVAPPTAPSQLPRSTPAG